MKYLIPTFLLMALALLGCQQNHSHEHSHAEAEGDTTEHQHSHGHGANHHMNKRSFEELVAAFEEPERAEWQKPDEVIALMGDIKGKTIMDIGCGTGYFAFRLAEAGANVICADADERFIEYCDEKKAEKGLNDTQFSTRKVPYESSTLDSAEADIVLVVDTYHHIDNRPAYFSEVKRGLKEGGMLMIVDFKKEETPSGPPLKMRLSVLEVKEELEVANFDGIEMNTDLLPYQYIVTGKK